MMCSFVVKYFNFSLSASEVLLFNLLARIRSKNRSLNGMKENHPSDLKNKQINKNFQSKNNGYWAILKENKVNMKQ